MEELWAFEHSIECPVSREFAWSFWTDVNNWKLDSDVESVELHGPFAAGSTGTTMSRSGGRFDWKLVDVQAPLTALIEIQLPGAAALFSWKFEELEAATRITQRASIRGEQAQLFVAAAASTLEAGIPAGMAKLCESIPKSGDKAATKRKA
jgi:Polyketide cyclase / dehydrase and lipid transport